MIMVYICSSILVLLILGWMIQEIQTINKTGHCSDYYYGEEDE